jgi:hypothetical protein
MFVLTFEVGNPALSVSSGTRLNILNIADRDSGAILIAVSTTETRALRFHYAGGIVLDNGPLLDPYYSTAYTTIVVTMTPNSMKMVTSTDYGAVSEISIPNRVNTTGRVYNLYLSQASGVSSGGTVRKFTIGRK